MCTTHSGASVYRQWLGVVALTLLSLGSPAVAATAAQSTDGSIVGQVTDESKSAMPGVTITASSTSLQVGKVSAVTDERGEYRLTPLPIGIYVVEYALSGFQVVRQEGVRLTPGFTAKLNVVLKLGQFEETVTVSGASPLVDVTATNTSTQLTRERLDLLPTIRESLTGLLQLVPGARPGLQASGAGFQNFNTNAFGRAGQPWQAIDGVVTVNPRASQSGNMFDFTSFEEATVSTLGHDASVPNSGPNINTVIKSGSNQFHGGAFFAGTGSSLQSKAVLAGGRKTTVKDEVNAELGGRLVRDKLWFWVGMRNVRENSELTEITDCVRPDGLVCDNVTYQKYLTIKPTYQINKTNRLITFFYVGRGRNRQVANLATWDSRRDHNFRPSAGKVEWQWIKGDSLVLTSNFGAWSAMSGSVCPDAPDRSLNREIANNDLALCTGPSTTDSVTRKISGLDPRTGERTQEGRVQNRTNISYYKPDWFHGNHEIKAGLDYFHAPQNRIVIGRGAAGNYQLVFQSGAANQIIFWNYPIHPDVDLVYTAGYVADSWTIGRNLTLNLGVRYGHDDAFENPTCRQRADGDSGVLFPAECFPELRLPVYKGLAPRLRAAYDLSGDGRTVIKGGWGRYLAMRVSDQVGVAAKQVGASMTFRWRDLNGNRDYNTGEVNLNVNGPDFLSRLGGSALPTALQGGVVNPNETAPFEDEYSLQLERQFTRTMALRITGLHTRARNQLRYGNPLRPYGVYNIPVSSLDPGADNVLNTPDDTGRTITFFDYPADYAGLAFQQVMFVNDSKANKQFTTMEVALSRSLSNNWQFQTSYTATKIHVPLVANAAELSSQDPNAEIFPADNTWEWQARASGSYLAPYGIHVSANFEHRSGVPYARTAVFRGGVRIPNLTLRVEPIGSLRLPNINILHMRAEKRLSLPNRQNLSIGVNVYNATNTQVATAITATSGPSFGVVTGRLLPRYLEFQTQYRF